MGLQPVLIENTANSDWRGINSGMSFSIVSELRFGANVDREERWAGDVQSSGLSSLILPLQITDVCMN